MFLQYMIFLVLTVPWFATGKKPKPMPGGSTITGQNELTLNAASGCKGHFVQPDCLGRIILLDDSSRSLVFGKGVGANSSSCKYHDGDLTADMDLPDWVLRDCNLKQHCDISADRLISRLGNTTMEYVMIKYFCIDRKPVYDMCQPITITGSTAYLISYGYPNMPFIEGITTECECTGDLMKKTPFSYRLLASDFKSLSERKYDCNPAQSLEINTKDSQKLYDCDSQGLRKTYESIMPKGGKDYVNFNFENELKANGGRFILEYIHNSDRFQLECNHDGRIMPPTTTSTTTTTTTPTPSTKAITSTTMPTTRTTVPTTTITTPTTTIIIPTITTMPITSFTTTIPRTTTQPPVSFTTTTTTLSTTTTTTMLKTTPTTPTVVIITKPTASPQKFTTTQQEITKPMATKPLTVVSPTPTKPYISTEPPVLTAGEGTTTSEEPIFLGADPQSEEPNLGMIIGVVVSLLVAAIIATILLIIFIRRKKRRSKLSGKMSEVDLVETEPSSSVYCDPETMLQTRFNTSVITNDYCEASSDADTRLHADSDGSNYNCINPLYGMNPDSGEDYSVIDNKHIRIKEYAGSFGTESSSWAVSVDAVGKSTSVPVYAVVNKQKGQDVPVYAQVNKTGKKSKEKGLNVVSDDVTSHSFENPLSGLPDQDSMPSFATSGTEAGTFPEDVYHTVCSESPGMTYSLEEGTQSAYALEGKGFNEYMDILPDKDPNAASMDVNGLNAVQTIGNESMEKSRALNPASTGHNHNGLAAKDAPKMTPDHNRFGENDHEDEYMYTYSHFPENVSPNKLSGSGNGYIGKPVAGSQGDMNSGGVSPAQPQSSTDPEYATCDFGETYASIDEANTPQSNNTKKGTVPTFDTNPSPEYFLYDKEGSLKQNSAEDEYHYIP